MSPRKLSDDDRQEILNLYRTTRETTSTLATRFGVSSSTISRFLKSNLSTLEYEDLIQEKRLARTDNYQGDYNPEDYQDNDGESSAPKNQPEQTEAESTSANQKQLSLSVEEESEPNPSDNQTDNQESISSSAEIKPDKAVEEEKNSVTVDDSNLPPETSATTVKQLEDIEPKTSSLPPINPEKQDREKIKPVIESQGENKKEKEDDLPNLPDLTNKSAVLDKNEDILDTEEREKIYVDDFDEVEDLESVNAIRTMFGEDVGDEDEDWGDEDEDEDDNEEEIIIPDSSPQLDDKIQVLPLSQAVFPRKCYLAVDRSSELMTRLLKDFKELGEIPPGETKQKTLPIFDNHRVAKRFCDRKGKVIKLPNGKMVEKTSSYLNAKGITRLLINGKIYSLS